MGASGMDQCEIGARWARDGREIGVAGAGRTKLQLRAADDGSHLTLAESVTMDLLCGYRPSAVYSGRHGAKRACVHV